MKGWYRNLALLVLMVPSSACGGNSRAPRVAQAPQMQPSESTKAQKPEVLEVEDDVMRLIEEGKVADAQALAKSSNTRGDKLVRLEGILYHGVGQTDPAYSALSKAHQSNPSDPTITILFAEVSCWKKDFDGASRLLETVSDVSLASKPRPWELAFHKARILGWLGKLKEAEAQYVHVHNLSNVPARVRLRCQVGIAEVTAWRKRYKQALQIIELALADFPENVEALLLKGQVQEWQGRFKDARTTYTRALQSNPDDATLLSRLEKLSWVK